MQSITKLPRLKGEKVLIRVDYNVPLEGKKIRDARRIESSYKTIDFVLKKGGTPILIAHLGDESATLEPIAKYIAKKYKVMFLTQDIFSAEFSNVLALVPKNTIVLLENIRRYPEEEKNGTRLAKRLASFGQYYINDAFSVSHRAHASVVGIPKLISGFVGFQLETEITKLSSVFKSTKHPFVFILGGSKFSTKIPLITKFLDRADSIIITGAILNTFYKIAGFPVGKSVIENGYEKQIKPLLSNPKVLLPTDVLVERNGKTVSVSPNEVEANDVIVDIGTSSAKDIINKIEKAKLVVWNGPTGWYEKGYTKATKTIAKAIAEKNIETIVGGGDTGAVIESALKSKTSKKIFISTGGGAALDFLAKGTLPGIDALQ